MQDLGSAIEQAAHRRQAAWTTGDVIEVARQTKILDGLYEDRRIERARNKRGSRAEIVKRARI